MAARTTIYQLRIALSDLDRGVYENLRLTIAKHPSEKPLRMLARTLAYALCYEPGLVFTGGVSDGDSPDLWVRDGNSRVKLWVEVGQPAPQRLINSCRHATQVVVFLYGGVNKTLRNENVASLSKLENLRLYEFDLAFLEQLVNNIERSMNWALTITEGQLYLEAGQRHLTGSCQQVELAG